MKTKRKGNWSRLGGVNNVKKGSKGEKKKVDKGRGEKAEIESRAG